MPDPIPTTTADSPWAHLQGLRAAAVPRPEWVPRLVAAGIDEASARMLVNALDWPDPSKLPATSFAPPVNPFSPGLALTELGLSGSPVTVGLYWLAFGLAVLMMLAVFSLLLAVEVVRLPPAALPVIVWLMSSIAAGTISWGSWRVVTSVRVRRRS